MANASDNKLEDTVLEVEDFCKSVASREGDIVEISRDVSFTLRRGEFVSIVGPSGAGKTTLLRGISGLHQPSRGSVRHNGQAVTGVPDDLSIVFQDYNRSLFAWMSVERNVEMGMIGVPREEKGRRTREALSHVGLEEYAGRYPWELSGGMQQRVAIARAMASRPSVLLMDEPFASVDALTRAHLEDVVLNLWSSSDLACLLVTHDVGEAVYLSDRVLVMSARPSTILCGFTVNLPRPRSQLVTRATPEFADLQSQVLRAVEDAARAALSPSTA